jgi:hypothetical protein
MPSDVRNSLSQAYHAALAVEPLNGAHLFELDKAIGIIIATLNAWEALEASKLTYTPKEPKP